MRYAQINLLGARSVFFSGSFLSFSEARELPLSQACDGKGFNHLKECVAMIHEGFHSNNLMALFSRTRSKNSTCTALRRYKRKKKSTLPDIYPCLLTYCINKVQSVFLRCNVLCSSGFNVQWFLEVWIPTRIVLTSTHHSDFLLGVVSRQTSVVRHCRPDSTVLCLRRSPQQIFPTKYRWNNPRPHARRIVRKRATENIATLISLILFWFPPAGKASWTKHVHQSTMGFDESFNAHPPPPPPPHPPPKLVASQFVITMQISYLTFC